VGDGDGLGVGSGVGLGVGEGVGDGVGDGVGSGVGLGVGSGVGEGLGVGVGEGLALTAVPVSSTMVIAGPETGSGRMRRPVRVPSASCGTKYTSIVQVALGAR